jgi:predicted Zn-dependent peptidase
VTPVPALAATPVEVTTLSNGLRVVTVDTQGNNASVGFYVKAGTRSDAVHGTAHALNAMAFRSTGHRSAYKLRRDLDNFGAKFGACVDREGMAYHVEALRDELPLIVDSLAEAVMQPRLTSWEVHETLEHAVDMSSEADLIHGAAFGLASGLGHGFDAEALEHIDADTLRAFLGSQFLAGNSVVVANNVPHAPFVDLMEATFLGLPEGKVEFKPSPYVGGSHVERGSGPTRVMVGFSGSKNERQSAAISHVLATMIGSTGHSHKDVGMAGCKAVETVAKSGGVSSLATFNHNYSSEGLFGFSMTATSGKAVPAAIKTATDLVKSIAKGVSARDLARAKARAKMSHAVASESRSGRRDDLAHQFLVSGGAVKPEEALAVFDSVTAEQVASLAASMLSSDISFAVKGAIEHVPRYDHANALRQ